MSAQNPKPIGVLGAFLGLIGFSALAGVLVTAMVTPAIAVTSVTANSAVTVFDDLPEYVDFGALSQRNTLWATQGGQPVPFATVYDQNRQEVPWDSVSQFAKDAAIAIEDERFYEHGGVDLAGIARAAVTNVTSDDVQGASTITQQLVKNLLIVEAQKIPDEADREAAMEVAQEPSLERKLREAKYAIGLEKTRTKQEILLGYLNVAGFGGNTYGIEAAAQLYFSTTAANLTLAQATSLVAIVQNPEYLRLDYPENREANQGRRDAILNNMLQQEKIDQAQYDEAIATPLDDSTIVISPPTNGCLNAAAAKQFCDFVTHNVKNLAALGANEEERAANWKIGGYDIYTSIDLDQQANAEAVLRDNAPADESRFELGAASSVVEVGTGRILVMAQNKGFDNRDAASGGGDPSTTAINFNTDFEYGNSRGFQVGSAYKLFTLINWLQNGHGLREVVDGSQRTYTSSMLPAECAPGNPPYPVRNDLGQNRGRINVLAATAGSVNAAFVNMASRLDLCDIRDTAESMGVHTATGDELVTFPSMVLGVDTIAPLTMANAYATVASGGVLCQPTAVDRIVDAAGNELPGQARECAQAISPEVAAAAAEALSGVMDGGTGRAANPYDGTELIGKTGTADALSTFIVTASTKVANAVWVGNIIGEQNLRRISVGGRTAGDLRYPISRDIMSSLNESPYGVDAPDFPDAPPSLRSGRSQPVPDVVGQTIDQARSIIQGVNLALVEGSTVPSDRPAGEVVSTSPGAGAQVSRGTAIEVQVSDGSLGAVMPNVVGQQLQEALDAIAGAEFTGGVSVQYVAGDDADRCTVTASDPGDGADTSKAAAVTLTVNGGANNPGSSRCQ